MFKSIVVGVDSSEHSRHAQTLASYLARKLHASVLGLHVVDILLFEEPQHPPTLKATLTLPGCARP